MRWNGTKHVELERCLHAFASRGFVSVSWAFLFIKGYLTWLDLKCMENILSLLNAAWLGAACLDSGDVELTASRSHRGATDASVCTGHESWLDRRTECTGAVTPADRPVGPRPRAVPQGLGRRSSATSSTDGDRWRKQPPASLAYYSNV